MPRFKTLYRIPKTQCFRNQIKYATNRYMYNIKSDYAWCHKYCKQWCQMEAFNDCINSTELFCKQNCQKECYYVGPIAEKPFYVDNRI